MKHCIPEEVKKNVATRYERGNTARQDVLAGREVLLWHEGEGRAIRSASGRVLCTSAVARQEHVEVDIDMVESTMSNVKAVAREVYCRDGCEYPVIVAA